MACQEDLKKKDKERMERVKEDEERRRWERANKAPLMEERRKMEKHEERKPKEGDETTSLH